MFEREAHGATAAFAAPGERLPVDLGGSGSEWPGLLRTIISSRSAHLPTRAGLAPTYARAREDAGPVSGLWLGSIYY